MKQLIFFSLLFLSYSNLLAQEAEYATKTNIPYYTSDEVAGDAYKKERCVLDLYYPTNKSDFATIVWFHGGGITAGEKELPDALKEKGIAIIGVNYRLNPKVKSPAYIEDAAAAIAWAFKKIKEYGGSSELIFVSGHSAGGYLASMVGMDKKYLEKHGIDANDIAGLIPFSGHTITHFTIRKERGIPGTQPIIDEFAPLYHVKKDAPPIVLITGDRELELLGRYEENAYFYRMMKVAGHEDIKIYEMDGYGHGMTYPAFPILIREVENIAKNKD
ncbi:alpha/beta hydrolase [Flexithrix dorotheae]|uniref:alpha/beta hydrolase n=1 Tax=Flexithrix dorotheae TaxID=70993 RepID=UPI0003784E3F|nr:alpha/beta hydrolase [Flexithrix dorotheae]